MTPKDVSQQEFEKAVFGGYDMMAVDKFISKITEDYAALFKENSVLKSKLKVLVEKVEEYRSTEDSMRMALLTAQKMGNEIVDEANKKSENIISEAKERADRRQADIESRVEAEEKRLREAQDATSKYSKAVLAIYKKQVEYIGSISELVIPEDLADSLSYIPDAQEPRQKSDAVKSPKLPQKKPVISEDALNEPVDSLIEQAISQTVNATLNKGNDDSGDCTDDEKNDIARSISESLGDTNELNIDANSKWDDEDEPTTKRPSFNFDDLQFGSKFGEDE